MPALHSPALYGRHCTAGIARPGVARPGVELSGSALPGSQLIELNGLAEATPSGIMAPT
jgi:hypothetical protein